MQSVDTAHLWLIRGAIPKRTGVRFGILGPNATNGTKLFGYVDNTPVYDSHHIHTFSYVCTLRFQVLGINDVW